MLVSYNAIMGHYPVAVGDYDHVGIRVVAKNYDDYSAQVGDVLPPSMTWDDGEPTGEYLPGTCAIKAGHQLQASDCDGYMGDVILIIGGNAAEYGDDDGEIIIRDAVVLARIELQK